MRRIAQTIERDDVVDDVMRQWPETIRIFLDFRMSCVGCPIAAFHTVEDTCREHGADALAFLAALHRTIGRRGDTEVGTRRLLSLQRP